jgi:phosphatidylglycerophosphate synthase
MSERIPSWVYIYGAFSVFMLQTMDALDGKHARVTGQSSSLGQFLDHGLDSFTNSFMIVIMLQSNLFGIGLNTFLIQFLAHVRILELKIK